MSVTMPSTEGGFCGVRPTADPRTGASGRSPSAVRAGLRPTRWTITVRRHRTGPTLALPSRAARGTRV